MHLNAQRIQKMREKLTHSLQPSTLEITDDSHLHAGHAGAKTGMGHFTVKIISEEFAGLSRLKQHQLVYQSLGEMMQDDIHALIIKSNS